MPLQYSTTLRNAQLDAKETAIGVAPLLKIYTGAQPANCAAAASGTLLCTITLPSDWLSAAASGVKSKLGTWSSTGVAAGTAAHYRIYESTGTTCHEQGTVTATGGGGNMTVTNTSIAVDQTVTVDTYTTTAGNA